MSADLDAANSAIEQAAAELEAGEILSAGKKLADANKLMKKINDLLSTDGTEGLM